MIKLLRKEQANALVEFALVLPFLLLFLLGTFDLGHGFVTYITLANGAREGAHWLSTHPSTSNPVEDARVYAWTAVEVADLDISQITVTPDRTAYDPGDEVTVAMDYPYPLLFGAIGPLTINMHVEATMTVLY
ncbi:hypothetical protein BH10CHL1_BH10CHL1_50560 [soil metagenome]